MNAPLPSTLMPARVLFLCRNESCVRMDVKSLRALGANDIAYIGDTADALAFLENERKLAQKAAVAVGKTVSPHACGVDAIVCEELLERAPASVFLYSLAQHPVLNATPVLVLAASAKNAALYRAAGVHVLERPYTPDQLAAELQKAMSPLRLPLSHKEFELAREQGLVLMPRQRAAGPVKNDCPMTTSDWYRKGMALLRKQESEPAREAFRKVLERQEDHLEACLALARTYQLEGDTEGVRGALLRAAAVCLRRDDKLRAAHIGAMLPVGMRNNIFAHEALVRMREGEYRAAALSFLEAGMAQSDLPLHRLVARACLMTTEPEAHMRKLCEAFEGLGHKLTAATLRRRLLEYPEFKGAGNSPSWLDKYPRLKEVVSVASYAAWAWKQA